MSKRPQCWVFPPPRLCHAQSQSWNSFVRFLALRCFPMCSSPIRPAHSKQSPFSKGISLHFSVCSNHFAWHSRPKPRPAPGPLHRPVLSRSLHCASGAFCSSHMPNVSFSGPSGSCALFRGALSAQPDLCLTVMSPQRPSLLTGLQSGKVTLYHLFHLSAWLLQFCFSICWLND